MTDEHISRPKHNPSPEEIEERCRQIRKTWSVATERNRRCVPQDEPYQVPQIIWDRRWNGFSVEESE